MQPFRSVLIRSINDARISPSTAAQHLYDQLKSHFFDSELNYYNKNIQTFQGIEALNDYRNWLKNRMPVEHLVESETLNKVAQMVADEKGRQRKSDHQQPRVIYQLIKKFGQVEGKIGELISLKASCSQEISTYFLLDDGNSTRSRRKMILDGGYKYIGIGSASHPVHEYITVILLAGNITS